MANVTSKSSSLTAKNPKTELKSRLWEQAQQRETDFIQAQELAQAQRQDTHAAMIARVAAEYDFCVSETETFFTASGLPLQLGMDIVSKTNPSDCCTVVFNPSTDDYFVYLPIPASLPAQAFVEAVKARVEKNRIERDERMRNFCDSRGEAMAA